MRDPYVPHAGVIGLTPSRGSVADPRVQRFKPASHAIRTILAEHCYRYHRRTSLYQIQVLGGAWSSSSKEPPKMSKIHLFCCTSLQASYLDIMHMTWQKCVYCFRGSPAELVSTSTEHRTIQNASSPRYVIAWARPSPVSGHIIFRQSLSRGDRKRYQVNICA